MRLGPVFLVLAAGAACFLAVAAYVWQGNKPYKGFPEGSKIVIIEPGRPARAAADTLQREGIIRSSLIFRLLVRIEGAGGRIHAGEYEFKDALSPMQVLDRLVRGDVMRHRLTIPEGLRMDETADLVAQRGFGDREEFLEAARDPGMISDVDPAAGNLEGYLFPDTYLFERGASVETIVAEMVARFRKELTPARLERMRELGFSLRQTVTMASLIEEEARVEDERSRISAVFHNRLRKGMLLQCDPTVVYALVRDGKYRGDIYRSDLDYDSPYNTYEHPGLPPGPISNPGASSLEAALYPAHTNELYFVVSGDGRHEFSTNVEDHEDAVRRYRRAQQRMRRR